MAYPRRALHFSSDERLLLTAELHQARLQIARLRQALAAGGGHHTWLSRSLENWLLIQDSRRARLRLFEQRHHLADFAQYARRA